MQKYIHESAKKIREKEGYYIMIKGAIQQEDIALVYFYVPNIGILKHIKQILMDKKGEIKGKTSIVENFNNLLTSMHRSSRQKNSKEIVALSDILDQIDFIDHLFMIKI